VRTGSSSCAMAPMAFTGYEPFRRFTIKSLLDHTAGNEGIFEKIGMSIRFGKSTRNFRKGQPKISTRKEHPKVRYLLRSNLPMSLRYCLPQGQIIDVRVFRASDPIEVRWCMRWRSNSSGKCSRERLTRGAVTSTMRRTAHPYGCARCGAGAACSATKLQSLPAVWMGSDLDVIEEVAR
jgi:hypothetical protein